ncbi:MAG: DNA recombination protein RmuC [Gammaproteobacteria bacterium]
MNESNMLLGVLSQETVWVILLVLGVVAVMAVMYIIGQLQDMQQGNKEQEKQYSSLQQSQNLLREEQLKGLADVQLKLEKRFGELQQSIEKRLGEMSQANVERQAKSNLQIQQTLNERLTEISGQVEKRLSKGFEKTTETFTDVVKRLALIDEAQKRITELSSNVVSLQEVLTDKRSRGAFGEVQMAGLVRNVMPENTFSLQHTLSNGKRADCMLFLPDPTGNIVIDSKFPLDSFQRMVDPDAHDADRLSAERQFKQDIKKHISDIADKYIIADETADGAIMFIPAEAVFAEIHAHHSDLVEEAQRRRVWMVSPTTMMAVLTTARAVLKDSATRKQVHLIQEHLVNLAKDFGRFRTRMDNLAKHIEQANRDVGDVHKSAHKISSRFEKIEKVELEDEDEIELLEAERQEAELVEAQLREAEQAETSQS